MNRIIILEVLAAPLISRSAQQKEPEQPSGEDLRTKAQELARDYK